MTKLIVWPLLSTCSKRAFLRTKKRWGHPYVYQPQARLLNRLMKELGLTQEALLQQMEEEREWLLQYARYYQ